jgi:hypothetical protein
LKKETGRQKNRGFPGIRPCASFELYYFLLNDQATACSYMAKGLFQKNAG